MDQALIASIRKSFESKSTEELRRAFEGEDKADKSPEEIEALRQLLQEREPRSYRVVLAVASAVICATLFAFGSWWQLGPGVFVVLSGVVGAVLGFASWYIPGLFWGTA
jgi:hypothetical protein